jgi:hypothetical protein
MMAEGCRHDRKKEAGRAGGPMNLNPGARRLRAALAAVLVRAARAHALRGVGYRDRRRPMSPAAPAMRRTTRTDER